MKNPLVLRQIGGHGPAQRDSLRSADNAATLDIRRDTSTDNFYFR
jgi:hypothetical protein